MRIRTLDPSVVCRIAAGEVVESPASVAKELLENALDAGASAISMQLTGGGIAGLRVTDNGCGMSEADAVACFGRHATSKIARSDDLYAIRTLGFRGEALYAIAAVSRIELLTRETGAVAGTRVTVEGDGTPVASPAGCPEGTTIAVRDLFYNTPARRKFLKRPALEAATAIDAAVRLMLAHPNVAFRISSENKTLHRSSGNGNLADVMAAIYGTRVRDALTEVGFTSDNIRVTGIVCAAAGALTSRGGQTFFVNGRVVRSAKLSAALEAGFAPRLMAHRFPIAVLDIHLPDDHVDIHVSPNKLRVRFRDVNAIQDALRTAVAQALSAAEAHVTLDSLPSPLPAIDNPAPSRVSVAPVAPPERPIQSADAPRDAPRQQSEPAAAPFVIPQELRDQLGMAKSRTPYVLCEPSAGMSAALRTPLPAHKANPSAPAPQAAPAEQQCMSEVERLPDYRVLGQLLHNYLLVERPDGLLIIDQHAAHERLLYDAWMRQVEAGDVPQQMLIVPAILHLQPSEYAALLPHLDAMSAIGLAVQPFGDSDLKVSALPLLLAGKDPAALLQPFASPARPSCIRDVLPAQVAKLACRAAVKAGDPLSTQEIQQLMRALDGSGLALTCPHGRPVAIAVPLRQLEKTFGRIV